MSGPAVKRTATAKIALNDEDENAPLVRRKHPYVENFYDALGKGPDRHKPRAVFMNNSERNFHNPLRFASNYISTTKYTPLTFIPKNLLEQFMKAANFYFLCVAIVVYIPGVTTIEPYTSVLPLVFVLAVTGIKEGYEDYQRYRSDIEINSRKVTIVTPEGEHKQVMWQDVVVGDVVRVENHAEFPVDLIVLSTSDVNGVCTIQTANLDGETNLKTRQALKDTCGLVTPQQLAQCRGRAVCEPPSNDLVSFEGVWKNGNVSIPLGSDQLLLRGARLEATEFVYGLCIYTGTETKISLNSNNPRHKRTKMDHVLNQQMYIIFFIQFCMVFLSGTLSAVYQRDFADKAWYFYLFGEGDTSSVASTGLINFFAYFILYSIMVPISLYVSMELVKVPQALLINFDNKMYDEETDTRALARTSSLNEELGQVEYVFSDKTGTLTQNKMSFYKCSIGGKRYGTEYVEEDEDLDAEPASPQEEIPMSLAKNQYEIERNEEIRKARFKALSKFRDPALLQDLTQGFDYPSGIQKGFTDKSIAANKKQAHFIQEFMLNMAVCHTVIPVGDEKNEANGTITYRGASIDEVALVIGANELGFSVVGRDRNILTVNLPWKKHNVYEILDILEFNSDRKRMSVVVKMPNGKYRLYTKGADSVIFPRLHPNNDEEVIRATKTDLEAFSAEGLRTLILAYADLEDNEYLEWARRYQAASQAIGGRREKMDAVANEIEGNLWLVGVSAIEDALQVGVPDTLHKLRHAGMKVWMLTGDKQGTAVNIGKSCGLIDQTYEIRYLNGTNKQDVDKELTALQAVMDRSAEVAAAKDAMKEKEVEVRIEHITRQLTHGKDRLPQLPQVPPAIPPRGASAAGNSVSMSHDLDEKKGPAQPPSQSSEAHQQDMTGENGKPTALIVDGPTLAHALHEQNRGKLLGCINHKMCRVVVCSRMAPKQKASVVELIKANLPCVTLAIGDGANDVSMIQAAHVGIGIRGKEGLQAVNNSDYAIAQFRFLARLLLVHGRLSYKRNAKLILYQFYKGIAISFTQLWFAIHSAFGAFQVFDGLLMNTFNLFFASLPILAVAVLDRELNPDELMAHPELYRPGIRGSGFNMRVFWTWIGSGILHSIFVFFLPFYSLPQLGFWTQSIAAYSCLVIAANAKISINTRTWTAWNAGLVTLSIGLWCLFGFGLSSKAAIDYLPHFYQTLNQAASTGSFWLCLLLMAWLAVMQEYVTGFLNRSAKRPELKLIIQEQRALKTKKGHLHDPQQPDSATAQYGKASSPHKRPSGTSSGGIGNDKL